MFVFKRVLQLALLCIVISTALVIALHCLKYQKKKYTDISPDPAMDNYYL